MRAPRPAIWSDDAPTHRKQGISAWTGRGSHRHDDGRSGRLRWQCCVSADCQVVSVVCCIVTSSLPGAVALTPGSRPWSRDFRQSRGRRMEHDRPEGDSSDHGDYIAPGQSVHHAELIIQPIIVVVSIVSIPSPVMIDLQGKRILVTGQSSRQRSVCHSLTFAWWNRRVSRPRSATGMNPVETSELSSNTTFPPSRRRDCPSTRSTRRRPRHKLCQQLVTSRGVADFVVRRVARFGPG
jgi:hypothetical protein